MRSIYRVLRTFDWSRATRSAEVEVLKSAARGVRETLMFKILGTRWCAPHFGWGFWGCSLVFAKITYMSFSMTSIVLLIWSQVRSVQAGIPDLTSYDLDCVVDIISGSFGSDGDSGSDVKEYCRWEKLNVSCSTDSAVMFRSASYGRMRSGRCSTSDYYVGCSLDALLHMDLNCSGLRRCQVAVPNPELHELQPCPKDLQTYLEADVECVKGFCFISNVTFIDNSKLE